MLKTIFSRAKSWSVGKEKKTAGVGIVFQVGPDKGMYIADLSADGAAEECKLLRKGDCLMSVDGRDVFQYDEAEVANCVLGKFGTQTALQFRRNVFESDEGPIFRSHFVNISLCLTRGKPAELPAKGGVGMILKEIDQALYVKSLTPDGPANACGKIKVNDVLVAVNGRDIKSLKITEVSERITGRFGSKVRLQLIRPNSGGGPPLDIKVVLTRGRKASFADSAGGGSRSVETITFVVPGGARPGEVVEGPDELGRRVKVFVPEGAIPGTLLQVPAPADSWQTPRFVAPRPDTAWHAPVHGSVEGWREVGEVEDRWPTHDDLGVGKMVLHDPLIASRGDSDSREHLWPTSTQTSSGPGPGASGLCRMDSEIEDVKYFDAPLAIEYYVDDVPAHSAHPPKSEPMGQRAGSSKAAAAAAAAFDMPDVGVMRFEGRRTKSLIDRTVSETGRAGPAGPRRALGAAEEERWEGAVVARPLAPVRDVVDYFETLVPL